jgi:hypothetical protein
MHRQASNTAVIAITTLISGALGLTFLTPTARSAAVNLSPSQQTLLKSQLSENYNCQLGEILYSREIEIGGEKQLEGRIRCQDQREIDFTQSNANQKFQLRLCQPTVC